MLLNISGPSVHNVNLYINELQNLEWSVIIVQNVGSKGIF